MLAYRSMLLLHREWILSLVSCKRLLNRVLLGLGPAWVEDIKLLGFGFHINNEVGKAVERIAIGIYAEGQTVD